MCDVDNNVRTPKTVQRAGGTYDDGVCEADPRQMSLADAGDKRAQVSDAYKAIVEEAKQRGKLLERIERTQKRQFNFWSATISPFLTYDVWKALGNDSESKLAAHSVKPKSE